MTIPGWMPPTAGAGSDVWNPIFLGLGVGLTVAALVLIPQWNRLPAHTPACRAGEAKKPVSGATSA
jgi:hypothetical protein